MHVIILAAGNSKRFREDGFMTPKPFIEIVWQGKTLPMIEHVINTIPANIKNIIAALPPDYKCSQGWFPIEKTTGPADTARQMIETIEPQGCLIMDSDILNYTNDLYRLTQLDGIGVLVSPSANPAFSYVNNLGTFTRIKEKERISEYAVRGAYFISIEEMAQFEGVLDEVVAGFKEPFLSHVFDQMNCKKTSLRTTYIPVDWGTPRDVKLSGARICIR